MAYANAEEEWGRRAADHVKARMKDAGVTYADMIKRLKKHGFKETEASLTMKLKRGGVCGLVPTRLSGGLGIGGCTLGG